MRYPFDLVAHQGATLIDGFLGRFPWVRDRSARALPLWSLVQEPTGLRHLARLPRLRAGGSRRLRPRRRRIARRRRTRTVQFLGASHRRAGNGNDRASGRRVGVDGGARGAVVDPPPPKQVHIWWHKAQFHLELEQYEAALALYDGPIRATQRPMALSLTNATTLLWRLAGGILGKPRPREMPRLRRYPRRDGRIAVGWGKRC